MADLIVVAEVGVALPSVVVDDQLQREIKIKANHNDIPMLDMIP